MKVTNAEWNTLTGLIAKTESAQDAKVMLEMWLDEKFKPYAKEIWDECKEYFDIDEPDDFWFEEKLPDDGMYED